MHRDWQIESNCNILDVFTVPSPGSSPHHHLPMLLICLWHEQNNKCSRIVAGGGGGGKATEDNVQQMATVGLAAQIQIKGIKQR